MVNDQFDISVINTLPLRLQEQWDALQPDNFPFGHFHFLCGLEQAGCVGKLSGWEPRYVLVQEKKSNRLIAVLPMYGKSHSYGEYIFDMEWAHFAAQQGYVYYPKLVVAIPYTPATGQRIFIQDSKESQLIISELVSFIKTYAHENHYSSIHFLFLKKEEAQLLNEQKFLIRHSSQYHFKNQGYKTFSDYLATLRSQKRKHIKRERNSVRDQGIEIQTLEGSDITESHMELMFQFYATTTMEKMGQQYLNEEFYKYLGLYFKSYMVVIFAVLEGEPVGGSLFFKKSNKLFGRYWGSSKYIPYLHFEMCYYQGIEYCIKNKLTYFEAGAQGEHKFLRGFEPVTTFSAHWFCNSDLQRIFSNFCHREKKMIKQNMDWLKTISPQKDLRVRA